MNLRRYISTTAAALLALGVIGAGAQVINKALQLSQDTTGAFSVDSNNGIYFPGHLLNSSVSNAFPTVAGTGSPTITGTDVAGTITMGTSATTATVTFGRAYVSVPNCVASWLSGNATSSPTAYTPVTTSIAFTQTATSANKVAYFCTGPQ